MKNTKTFEVSFNNLAQQHFPKHEEFTKAFNQILNRSKFVLGEELSLFESEFQLFLNTKGRVIGVANGSDALSIALNLGKYPRFSEVMLASNTYFAAAAAVIRAGLTLKLIDVDLKTRFPSSEQIAKENLTNVSVFIRSHLYGGADVSEIPEKYKDLQIIHDASQAHGTKLNGRFIGENSITTFSFYPGKNLGAFGDAGALVCFLQEDIENCLMLRNQGTYENKYFHQVLGFNSRLDEIQAAVLRIKLRDLEKNNISRQNIFSRYKDNLKHYSRVCTLFEYSKDIQPSHHLVQIRIPGCSAQEIGEFMGINSIETGRHYPRPLHLQEALKNLGYSVGDFPNAETLANESLSLPIYPGMESWKIDYVCEKLIEYVNSIGFN